MNEPFDALKRLLIDVVLPNLRSVQVAQAEQIAANDRLEQAIEDLRVHIDSDFAHLAAQLTACRAELGATQAELKAARMENGASAPACGLLIH